VKKVFFILICSSMLFVGCSSHKKIVPTEEEKTAYEWYNEGIQEYINHDYAEARHSLEMVNEQHPGSVYAKRATLALGDVYFAKGEYILARDYYSKFIKLYPNEKDVVYAKYKIALSYYKSRNGYKLDSTPAKLAIEHFLSLLKEYPSNPYTEKIYAYIAQSAIEIYRHELFVAEFYKKLDNLKAAKNRLDYMYNHFKDVSFNDKMLYLLGSVYYRLGKKEQAKAFFEELKSKYPNSSFVKEIP
jgi:outer membrane protein assembly factor BamD